jgi:isopentenyl-diphosphate delta-isomerase
MSKEFVILVDENDNPIGSEEKVKCHLPDGKLHRAFTALLFDDDGRLILTKRAKEKMLWPNDWDGTFASHPRESETYVSSGERRMPEELGIDGTLDYLHKFEYHVPYKDVGSENEMDVTGGMTRKVEEASKIAKMGMIVFFANGNTPERIVKAVKNKIFEGTLFRGKRNV